MVVVSLAFGALVLWQHSRLAWALEGIQDLVLAGDTRAESSGAAAGSALVVIWREVERVFYWTTGAGVMVVVGLGAVFWWRDRQQVGVGVGESEGDERRDGAVALRLQNEELLRFTRAVSHDLRSPLVTIQTFLTYLGRDLEKGDKVRVKSDLGHIGAAAAKMEQMLEELLVLSRAGQALVEVEDVDLGSVIREALGLVAGQVRSRGVEVRLPQAVYVVRGERRRLVQLFQNLLDNAVKYIGEQMKPVIDIDVEPGVGGGRVVVRDNGVGIDPRDHTKVFEVFVRLHSGGHGGGVGLAVVKRIAESHRGRVWVESAGGGGGSSFIVELPGIRLADGKDRVG